MDKKISLIPFLSVLIFMGSCPNGVFCSPYKESKPQETSLKNLSVKQLYLLGYENEVEKVLVTKGKNNLDTFELGLLYRIYVHQGKVAMVQEIEKAILKLDPANPLVVKRSPLDRETLFFQDNPVSKTSSPQFETTQMVPEEPSSFLEKKGENSKKFKRNETDLLGENGEDKNLSSYGIKSSFFDNFPGLNSVP